MPTFKLRRGALAGLPTGAAGEPLLTTDEIRLYIGGTGGNRLVGLLHKVDATTAPVAGDDSGDGYSPGSLWVDVTNDKGYVCVDNSVGAAIWQQISGAGTYPVTSVNGQTGGVVLDVPGYEAENKDAATLDAGMTVTVHTSSTGVWKADAATAGYEAVGIVAAAVAPTFSADVRTTGKLTLADWTAASGSSTLTPNAPYYLSATPGFITATPPNVGGQRVQQVGVAVSPDTLSIQIMPPVLL